MQRRIERLIAAFAIPLMLGANMAGMVAFASNGGHVAARPASAQPTTTEAPTPRPTALPPTVPPATPTPSPTPDPQINGFVTRTYTDPSSGAKMTYYLHIPSGYLPSRSYPVVLLLHGTGEAAITGASAQRNANALLGDPYVKVWSSSTVQAHWPSFILVPQVIANTRWTKGTPSAASYTLPAQAQPALQLAMDILALVRTDYAIDPLRVYLTGISMGGYGAWEAAERWPTAFAAVVPVSGAGDPSKSADLLHLPVWAFQSAGDKVVPIAGSLNMLKAIKAAGGHPCFTEFSGSAHDISTWMAVYTNKVMFTWLFAQGTPAATASGMPQCAA